MPVLYVLLGVVSLAAGDVGLRMPAAFGDPTWEPSVAAALGVGLVLAVALWVVSHLGIRLLLLWPAFERSIARDEVRRTQVPLAVALAASVAVSGGEELFWRGLVQAELGPWLQGRGATAPFVVAAVLVWIAFWTVLLASGSLPLLAGGLIPGAVWAALPLLTGGIVAGFACHVGWTVLIVALPPGRGGRMMPS
jgi:membrane protease YdiL (CAAX protease family)